MKKKQFAFIALGLIIATAIFSFAKLNIATAVKVNGKIFHDWKVICLPADEKNNVPEVCTINQQFEISKDGKQQVVAIYQFGYFGATKELKFIQIVPLGVGIEAGTSIVSSKKLIAPGKFTTCTTAGCQAAASISDADLKILLSNTENSLAFINGEGKQVNLPISIKGLNEALDYIK